MKKMKFLSLFLSIFTLLLLSACGNDNRQAYIDQLETLDRTDLSALNNWLDENDETMYELFEFVNIRVDLEGNELDFMSQVLGLDIDYFESWSFEVEDDVLTFTYIWDYERANYVPEVVDPLAADHSVLVAWISGDIMPFIEDINVEEPRLFWASLAGFISGTRTTLEDLNISVYLETQINNVLNFLEDISSLVLQNVDDPDLDLTEVRDIILESLTDMLEIFEY